MKRDFDWFPIAMFFTMYIGISIIVWMVRAEKGDCAHRYVDYVFPISKLHCEIK